MIRLLSLIAIICSSACLASHVALADCALAPTAVCDGVSCGSETRPEGHIAFNADAGVFQYCDGTLWRAMLGSSGGGFPSCPDGDYIIMTSAGWTCDGSGTGGGGGGPTGAHKKIFITSIVYDGNIGGIFGADAECQSLADAQSLGGTYKAWLSTTTTSTQPASHFTQSTDPYKLLDNTVIANDWTDLTDGTIAAPININESGNAVPAGRVWTNVDFDGTTWGTSVGTACSTGWTSSSQFNFGNFGLNDQTDSAWTISGSVSCDNPYRLYCFEQ